MKRADILDIEGALYELRCYVDVSKKAQGYYDDTFRPIDVVVSKDYDNLMAAVERAEDVLEHLVDALDERSEMDGGTGSDEPWERVR